MSPDLDARIAAAAAARRTCRYPDAPHTCWYICDHPACWSKDAELVTTIDGYALACPAHQPATLT